MKFFRILIILWGLSSMFWDTTGFINRLLVSLFQTQVDYACWKHSSLKISSEVCIKGTLLLSSKTFSVVIIIIFLLLAIKKKVIFITSNVFRFFFFNRTILRGYIYNIIYSSNSSKFSSTLKIADILRNFKSGNFFHLYFFVIM